MAPIIIQKLNCSFINKILFVFFLLIIFIIVQFCTQDDRISMYSLQVLNSSCTTNTPAQCQLSLYESDGWFCELDSDWTRRKALHHLQHKRNHISDSRRLFFQNNWEPTIQCKFERRLGNPGDGGKWICDIHRFKDL